MALNFPADPQTNDTYTEGNITWQFDGTAWNIVGSSSAANIPNSFNTIVVDGQESLLADETNDTLTFVAGSNVVITTNDLNDSITISSTASGGGDGEVIEQDLFSTVNGDTGSTTANSPTDILTVSGGSNISTSVSGDVLTISYTGATGAVNFTGLADVSDSGASIDQVYLPAITMLNVSNVGASAYRFDQYGSTDNPTIYAINGTTIAFNLDISGHPFLIQDSTGTNFNTGLIHVATDGTVSTGSEAQGQTSGTLYWKIPTSESSPPNYRYQCSVHLGMVGAITIKNFAGI